VLGEIANIIAGRAKPLMESEFRFETSLPMVALGTVASLPTAASLLKGQEHSSGSSVRNICIPFTIFGNECFILSVSVQSVGLT
jgi:CheY-specific phosphatase CheX